MKDKPKTHSLFQPLVCEKSAFQLEVDMVGLELDVDLVVASVKIHLNSDSINQ